MTILIVRAVCATALVLVYVKRLLIVRFAKFDAMLIPFVSDRWLDEDKLYLSVLVPTSILWKASDG